MRFGKLTTWELQSAVLDKIVRIRDEIILSAAQGEDCAAAKTDDYILFSSDPITAPMPPKSLGELVVSVCCNDIRACGGEPFGLLLTVIVPPNASVDDVADIMSAASESATKSGVEIIGGHTEFSDCVTRPIVCGTAVGKAKRIVSKLGLKVGQKLFVTKTLGMEGAAVIADSGVPLSSEERLVLSAFKNSLSVAKESEILSKLDGVGMMHDITEGGVLGAVAEVCTAVGLGATLYEEKIPIEPLTERLCKEFAIDPFRLISSGSMLFSASDDLPAEKLSVIGIPVTEIGRVTEGEVLLIRRDGSKVAVEAGPDEMYKFFGSSK